MFYPHLAHSYVLTILRALKSPGWQKEWHVGVRAANASRKLLAFISGIPVEMRVRANTVHCAEINFLCIHKKLRSKRLAPVLIKEITRRINLQSIQQAVFTAGIVLPKPVSTCRYYHRSLDWAKLNEVGFSPLPPQSTKQRQIARFALPATTALQGLRAMEEKDVDKVLDLLKRYLARFDLAPVFTREEVVHWLLYKETAGKTQVIWTYVVEVCAFHIYVRRPNLTLSRILIPEKLPISSPSTPSNHQ
jgi:glycylpeptide N-tetradecanoyltransferase